MKQGTGKSWTGYNVPYMGKNPTLKKLFDWANERKLTNEEIAEALGVSGVAVGSWRWNEKKPRRENMNKIKELVKDYDAEGQMTLLSVQPPKDKRDGEIFTFRTDTPWLKDKAQAERGITDDQLIEYAIKGMPEDVRVALLKQMLTERTKR